MTARAGCATRSRALVMGSGFGGLAAAIRLGVLSSARVLDTVVPFAAA